MQSLHISTILAWLVTREYRCLNWNISFKVYLWEWKYEIVHTSQDPKWKLSISGVGIIEKIDLPLFQFYAFLTSETEMETCRN